MFVLTFTLKLKDTNYKNHWNNLVLCDQWNMTSVLNMSHGKMSDFVSFVLLAFSLVIKLRNFNFDIHSNNLIFLIKKMMSDLKNVLSNSVKLPCLSSILNLGNLYSNQNSSSFFLCVFFLLHCYKNSFELKKFIIISRYIDKRQLKLCI